MDWHTISQMFGMPFFKNHSSSKSMELPETFCPNPWVQICSTPTGSLAVCGEAGEIHRDIPIADFFNIPQLKELRQSLSNGERPKHCNSCWLQEKQGRYSTRMHTLELYAQQFGKEFLVSMLERSRKNGFEVELPIKLDIKPSSLCNLSCRMCDSDNSSKLWKEYDDNRELFKNFKYYYDYPRQEYTKGIQNYTVDEWLSIAEKMLILNISGGEPTLIRDVLKLVEALQFSGYSKKIDVTFNTNGTHFNEKLFSQLKNFKGVGFFMSLDGTESIYEYIRYPAKWSETQDSFLKIKNFFNDAPHIKVYATPTYQIFNILHLTDIYRWCDSVGIEWISDSFVTTPMFQNASILPYEIREIAAERVEQYYHERQGKLTYFQARGIPHTIKHLKSPHEDHSKSLMEFWEHTQILDKLRGQSMKKSCPELFDLMQKYSGK